MKTIEVKSCAECPFILDLMHHETCFLNLDIEETIMPYKNVHENCPLKKESATVKIKEQ